MVVRVVTLKSKADHQERGRKWARRQLRRLKRGELPVAEVSSVEEVRAMRAARAEQLETRSNDPMHGVVDEQ